MRKIIRIPRIEILECQGNLRIIEHDGVKLEMWWDECTDCLCIAEIVKEKDAENE